MRVLHLVGAPHADAPPWRTAPREGPGEEAALAACAGVLAARTSHAAVLVGASPAARLARLVGLRPGARLAPPLRDWRLAAPALRRLLRTARPRAIIAWGEGLGTLARHASLEAPCLDIDLATGTLREHGRGEGEYLPACAGGVPITAVPTRARHAARIHRLVMIGSRRASLPRLAYAASIAGTAGEPCDLIAPAWARGLRRAARVVREGGYVRALRVVPSMIGALGEGCEAAVCPAEGELTYADLIAIDAALARGVRVVAPDSPATRGLLTGSLAAGLAASCDKADLARAIVRVIGEGRECGVAPPRDAAPDALARALDRALERHTLGAPA